MLHSVKPSKPAPISCDEMPLSKRRTAHLLAAAIAMTCVSTVQAQDVSAPAILQWYEAEYQSQENRLPDFFMAGYGNMWIPPTNRADSGNQSVGYDVFDRFDLGGPRDQTLYGTERGLKTFIDQTHRLGGRVTVDYILNHNGFSDTSTPGFVEAGGYPGFVLQTPELVDGDFHGRFAGGEEDFRLAGLIDIDQSLNLQYIRTPVNAGDPNNIPAGTFHNVPDPDNARYYADQDLGGTTVWDPRLQQNVTLYDFNTQTPLAGDAVMENALGLILRNTRWMVQEIGVDGFRLDAARHFPRSVLDYFDQATFLSKQEPLLDGSPDHVFSFIETGYDSNAALQEYIRKDIDNNNLGTIGGNRDALDFNLFGALVNNLTDNGLQNDWNTVVGASIDLNDDGFMNGSQGVRFASSHDEFGPALTNVAHAYVMMLPGNSIVYHNAKEFGENRDFPKDGRGDALGNFGDTITTLTNLRVTHGRGNYLPRLLEKENLIFEREGSALVLLSNRGDSGFDSRTVQTSHAPGTYLVELTGNGVDWNNQVNASDIPEVIQVKPDGTVDVRVLRNGGGDRGYLIYGLPTPQSSQGIQLTNVSQVLLGGDANETDGTISASVRLTDLPVIQADSFEVRLETQAVNLLGSLRDRQADGDNAVIKVNGGLDVNGNGFVDLVQPDSVVYGYEQFTDVRSPGFDAADGNGVYAQNIDATALPEGENYITVRAFRQGGSVPVFSDFRQVVYVDRLEPEVALDETIAFDSSGANLDFVVRSLDQTAETMHFFLNLPANVSDATILALADDGELAEAYDRDLFLRGYFDVKAGNNVLTVLTEEITGTYSVRRLSGIGIDNGNGAGLGDLNFDGQITSQDLTQSSLNFETYLYTQNSLFNPAADITGDGRIDNLDLFALGGVVSDADGATQDTYEEILLRRFNYDGDGGTDASDIDELYDLIDAGVITWDNDVNVDGVLDTADIDTLIALVFGTSYGDANLDGSVDLLDLDLLGQNWELTDSPIDPIGWAAGDFNGDGTVSLLDLDLLGANWQLGDAGAFAAAAAAIGVPEPSVGMFVLTAVFFANRRRR